MSDIWSHSHDWDNGYAKGHKDGYQQGTNDTVDKAIEILKKSPLVKAMGEILKLKEQKNEH